MFQVLKSYSLNAIIIVFAFIISIFFYYDLWNKNRIVVDAPSYYTYMPALFIYNDLHLNFIDSNPAFFKDKIWYYKIENNKRLIKHPIGFSVLLTPFFLIGHFFAKILGAPEDGYSMPYQNMVSIGVLFYLIIGLYFLRKFLLEFYSDKIVALTIISIVIGTNLLWYSSFEGLMPHCISFSLFSIAIYFFKKWLFSGRLKHILNFSIAFGFIVLIRPLSIIAISYFLLFAFLQKKESVFSFDLLKKNYKNIILASLVSIIIICFQFLYWKYATGKWIYDPYIDEHFLFNSPQIIPFLFSFRKGVFVYYPILLFAIIGLVPLYKKERFIFYATLFLLSISIYILSSWWAWSYGICWGMRPMIDNYSILCIPLAAGFTLGFNRNIALSCSISILIGFFILLNLFQTWQYKNGLIHYDNMSKESYFKGFFQTKISNDWLDMLKPYDWERRIKGLPQISYSKKIFSNLKLSDKICLRASNLYYLSVNNKANNLVAAYINGMGKNETFFIEFESIDIIHIRSTNGYLFTLNSDSQNTIATSEAKANNYSKFKVEFLDDDNNRIALKASNGKYLSMDNKFPYLIKADTNGISKREIFRYIKID